LWIAVADFKIKIADCGLDYQPWLRLPNGQEAIASFGLGQLDLASLSQVNHVYWYWANSCKYNTLIN